jgi:hypothetical protein
MKREYVTPDIMFDSFALNENIASANQNCTRNITGQYSGSCGLHWEGMIIFTGPAIGCRNKVPDGSAAHDGICYYVPTGDNRVFNS